MGRAAQARVEGPDNGFHSVEGAFRRVRAGDEPLGHLQDAPVHRQIIVAGGDDQIGPGHEAVLVDPVVMDECSARRFDAADAFEEVRLG